MMHRKELWAILIVVAAVAGALLYAASRAVSQVILIHDAQVAQMDDSSAFNTSTWVTYTNDQYGFSITYPTNWQISTTGLAGALPSVVLGNPLSGTTTYAMQVIIEPNVSSLTSGEYVHALLAADKAQDIANAASGPSPSITPQFKKSYLTEVANQQAYELYSVFEFDHNAEQIFVAHGTIVLHFDLPVADENPNLSSPANNNAIAHLIMNTLSFK